ncbi:MAG TPA: hypothetical protein VGE27_15990 [Gemmatimonas sp.]|uniref:CAF17-like 4Fe-4S cluster assembly/insertion protein YgfZ n=1 Tax=Gemmatimonas sp. TaxID=1962908 RepID=UPI002EDA2BAE
MSTLPESSSLPATSDAPESFAAPAPLTAEQQRHYDALRAGVTWFTHPGRWSRIHGPKATDALNGLVTNDVSLLAEGTSQYAAALTPKGKMVADMTIVRADADTFFISVDATAVEGWLGLARKYINPRLARTTDESALWVTCAIYGQQLQTALQSIGVADPDASGAARIGDTDVRVVQAPTLSGVQGVWVMVPADRFEAIRERIVGACGPEADVSVAELLRIEGGRPTMFIDMDENTIPQEANLDALEAISFTKGCYTGQETVARVHFRGHVNKHLRGLSSTVPLVRGTQLVDDAGKVIGDVRSTAVSPRLGAIAIGMVRREIAPGTSVHARLLTTVDGGSVPRETLAPVRVEALPFSG